MPGGHPKDWRQIDPPWPLQTLKTEHPQDNGHKKVCRGGMLIPSPLAVEMRLRTAMALSSAVPVFKTLVVQRESSNNCLT